MSRLSKVGVSTVGVCIICTAACRTPNWQSGDSVAVLQAERRAKVEKSIGVKQCAAELQLAKDAWKFGDRTACLAAVDRILERDAGHVEALLLKAEVHVAKNELADANRSIAIALSHDQNNAKAKRLQEIARTKQLAERPEEAEMSVSDSELAQLPGPVSASTKARPATSTSIAAATQPTASPVLTGETATYESYDVSAGTAEATDQDGSADSHPVSSSLTSAIGSGASLGILASFEAKQASNPNDPQIPISATVAALEANQPATAVSIARRGIASHPTCAGLHRTLGAALYRIGDYKSSQVALQQALSLDNSSALSYFLMGCVSEKLGDAEAAESHFARATELDPTIAAGK